MKKYLALYMAPNASIDEMIKNATPEMQKAGMDSWLAWASAHKSAMVDMGAPAGKNMRVTAEGAVPVRNEVTGYSVVQAASPEAATAVFADCPHLTGMQGAYVEVLELMDMSGR